MTELKTLFLASLVALFLPGVSWATNTEGELNAKDFGAVCDGGAHPLSGYYANLAAAQAVYPFVTALTQQIDYAALKKMSNTALGADGSEHGVSNSTLNVPMFIPQGNCQLGGDTWKISNASGLRLRGAGSEATVIHSNAIVFQTDGLWYSHISDIGFARDAVSGTEPALDIDGNTGHAGATIGVQNSLFSNITVDGNNNAYAIAVCRQGGGYGQCSGLAWNNLFAQRATFAVYYQNGFNALNNQFNVGDMQNYSKHGIYLNAGSVQVFGLSFESTSGYTQLANGGCDIDASSAGTFDPIVVRGARSESLCFYNGSWSQMADLGGILVRPGALGTWAASHAYALNTLVTGATTRAFRVTTAGTSGGSEPTWPSSGSVTDGSVVWTKLDYNAINFSEGHFDRATSFVDYTATVVSGSVPSIGSCGGTTDAASGSTRWVGSVTEGAGGTGCTMTSYPLNWSPIMRCVVSNRNGTAFTYSQDGGDIYITNAALGAASTFDWICSQ